MSSISKLFKHVRFSLDGLTLVKSNEKMMDIPPPFQSTRQAIVKSKKQQINGTMQKKGSNSHLKPIDD
jgi:hypothetical protein